MRRPVLALPALLVATVGLAPAGAASAAEPTTTAATTPAPTTFFLDCSAKSGGDGTTAATAWRSLSAVDRHGDFTPGQRILLRRGTTCKGRLTPAGSGSAGHPIVLGAYGSGARPTVAGGGTANFTGAVQLTNQRYWTVQDLRVTNHTGASTKTYRSGVLLLDSNGGRLPGITVQRLVVEDVVSDPAYSSGDSVPRGFGGISALTGGTKGVGFDGLRILDNHVDHVGRSGIIDYNLQYAVRKGHDRNTRISGNRVTDTRGDGIVIAGEYGGRIDHNVAARTGKIFPCSQCKHGRGPETADAAIWTVFSNGVHIDHNEAYRTINGGGDGQGFDIDVHTRNTVLEDNYSHDNEGGGILLCASLNATVRFNVIQNNGRGQIVFTCGKSHTVRISNNDIYLRGNALTTRVVDLIKGAGSTGVSFTNNLVWAWGTAKYEWPGAVHAADNTFVGSHHWTEPDGAGTIFTAPAVRHPGAGGVGWASLGAYRLKAGHHVQRGVAISTSVKVDILGHPVNAKHPARGAFSR